MTDKNVEEVSDDCNLMNLITRVEVIDDLGSTYRWNCSSVLWGFQDEGRTLKIFVKEKR